MTPRIAVTALAMILLVERLEKQRDELNEKLNNIKCEGK